MASKLPDLSSLSMDELTELVSSANGRISELRQAKIEELRAQRAALDAELEKLGDVSKPGKPRLPAALSGGETRKRASPKVTHRGPNGETWTSRGAKPRWLQDLLAKGRKIEEFAVSE